MNKILVLLTILALVCACTSSKPQNQTTGAVPIVATGVVKEFSVTATNFAFEPGTIEVNLGDTVRLHLLSKEGTHGLAIPAFNITQRMELGQPVDVEFVADQAGTFPFVCSVPCGSGHRQMRGSLIVH